MNAINPQSAYDEPTQRDLPTMFDRIMSRAWTAIAVGSVLILLGLGIAIMTMGSARGDTAHSGALHPEQPYGGCAEAYQAPRSAGADDCRALGWTVTAKVVTSPHALLRYLDMPPCKYEDGSGQRKACVWFAGSRGNGIGASFWERAGRVHYFWPRNPLVVDSGRSWLAPRSAAWVGRHGAVHYPNGRVLRPKVRPIESPHRVTGTKPGPTELCGRPVAGVPHVCKPKPEYPAGTFIGHVVNVNEPGVR